MGDSLQIQAQVWDVAHEGDARAGGTILVPASAPTQALEAIRQQVLGALATRLDPKLHASTQHGGHPPRYEAYRAYAEGQELFIRGDMRGAAGFYRKAAALDATFRHALLFAAVAYGNLGEVATVDSLISEVSTARDQLAPRDRIMVDWFNAQTQSEWLHASRQLGALAPDTLDEYQWGLDALRAQRSREAVAVLTRMNPDRGTCGGGWVIGWYYRTHTTRSVRTTAS